MEEKSREQEMSAREISLIRELAQIRKEYKRELEYEKFDGYLHLGLYTPNQGVPKHSGSLFHSTRAVTEKKKILEEEFGVAMNEELEREVLVMCNLSQGVKAEGISIGEMRMLVKQVRKGRVTIEEAAEDAGMTVEECKKILENTPLQAV